MTLDPESGLHLPNTSTTGDEQRSHRLHELGLAQMRPDPEFDDFATELGQTADVPVAMVNLFHSGVQYFAGLYVHKSADLYVDRTMSREHGYCPETMTRERPLVLWDVCAHPRFAGNAVVDEIGIRTYAGTRFIDPDTGLPLGTLCLVGTEPRDLAWGKAALNLIKDQSSTLQQLMHRRAPLALR